MEDQWVRCPRVAGRDVGAGGFQTLGSLPPPSCRDPLPLNLREFIIFMFRELYLALIGSCCAYSGTDLTSNSVSVSQHSSRSWAGTTLSTPHSWKLGSVLDAGTGGSIVFKPIYFEPGRPQSAMPPALFIQVFFCAVAS